MTQSNDANGKGDAGEPQELEALIARNRESAPATLDARVAATLRAARGESGATSLRRRLVAAAAVLLGGAALTFAAVRLVEAWRSDAAPSLIEPVAMTPADTPRGSDAPLPVDALEGPMAAVQRTAEKPQPPPVDPLAAAPSGDELDDDWDPVHASEVMELGFPRNVNARATLARAPIVARLRTIDGRAAKHPDGRAFRRPIAVIERVYHGDPDLVGKRIELHACVELSPDLAFLSWSEESFDPLNSGEHSYVTCFERIEKAPLRDGTLHAQQLFAHRWGGFWLPRGVRVPEETSSARMANSADEGIALLLADLAASAGSGDPDCELSAVVALRHFDGGESPMARPESVVWHNAASRDALLRAGRSGNAKVRWNIAWMNPAAAGPAGVELLFELAFDFDPLVREPALHWLSQPAEAGFADDGALAAAARELAQHAQERADYAFDEMLTAALDGPGELFDDASLARHLERMRGERNPDARRRAVLALASIEQADAVQELLNCLGDGDAGVRRAAAFVLASAGFDHSSAVMTRLQEVPDHEEPSVQALVGYAEIAHGSVVGFDRMARLLESGAPVVREQVVQLLARAGTRPMDAGDLPLLGDGDVGIAGLLLRAVGDADPLVRSQALLAVSRLRGSYFEGASLGAEWESAVARAEADSSALVRAAAGFARRARTLLTQDERRALEALGYVENDGN